MAPLAYEERACADEPEVNAQGSHSAADPAPSGVLPEHGAPKGGPAPSKRAPNRSHTDNCDSNDSPLCLRCSVARSLRAEDVRCTHWFAARFPLKTCQRLSSSRDVAFNNASNAAKLSGMHESGVSIIKGVPAILRRLGLSSQQRPEPDAVMASNPPESRTAPISEEEAAALRSSVRKRVLWAAKLVHGKARFDCVVVDLSLGGARIYLVRPLGKRLACRRPYRGRLPPRHAMDQRGPGGGAGDLPAGRVSPGGERAAPRLRPADGRRGLGTGLALTMGFAVLNPSSANPSRHRPRLALHLRAVHDPPG